jgi:hypothetical protein
MSENTTSGDTSMPPKLNLKQSDQPATGIPMAGRDAKSHTARINLPETPPEPAPALKKKTSRIPLDQVSAEPGAPAGSPVLGMGTSKTIRLSPLSPSPTITIVPSQKVLSGSMILDDAKRQTSRIPLELAISEKDNTSTSQPNAPKTIRIKRPNISQSIPAPVQAATPPPAQESTQSPMSRTSPIDIPEQESPDSGQATQRKTIRIRRPEGGSAERAAPRSLAVARIEKEAAANVAAELAGGVSAPHPIFPALAAVAVILLCVLVYVLFTQAFPTLGWTFPGKITL